ncbi:MAG: adenylate/guanylate cyclase domain-containing protein [Streptosporangiales bacterium]|nr:adenylate/guanylate cyclase domain-containing protein [Streptosporangiales bacterium]
MQVAERAGVPLERANRLWSALGFVGPGDDAVVFTDDDVRALAQVAAMVDQGVIDRDAEASLTRSVGQTMSRLADWQIRVLRDAVADPERAGTEQGGMAEAVAALVPVMEQMQSYVWRRHLAAAAGRLFPVSAADPTSTTVVVGFADVVGFTRFSRTTGDAELGAFVEHFEDASSEIVAAHHGRVVKTIGDEVMFVADDPRGAAGLALDLVERTDADDGFPALRVGLAYGPVLSRLGDVYGPVVNVAARLTSLARPSSVLVDRALHEALAEVPDYELRRLRRVAVRGYARLEPWALHRR